MSDERPPEELIELPLGHKDTWKTVDKGEGAMPEAQDRRPPPRQKRQPEKVPRSPRQRLAIITAVVVVAALAYWLFWPSAPQVEFGQLQLEFAEQLAGSVSEVAVVTVTNAGERILRIQSVGVVAAEAPDFETDSHDCSGVELAEGERCRVGVRFAPQAAGARTADLVVHGNMRGGQAALPLVGASVAPRLSARPATVDFGAEAVGATSPGQDLELVNSGSAPLSVRSVDVAAEDREFRLIGNQCSSVTLAPGESCGLRLVFKPSLLGRRSAELGVESDSFGDTDPIVLQGSGSGPDLRVDPEGLVFEEQLVGTRSEPARLTLTNRGDAPFRMSRVWIDDGGPFSVVQENCSRNSLAPDQNCRVDVVFSPGGEGSAKSRLQIRESSGAMAPGVAISGRGVSPRLEVDPGAIDFAAVLVGESASGRAIEVSNAGTARLEIEGVVIGGDDAAAFPAGTDSCSGARLEPGQRCKVTVGFRPVHAGAHSARVEVRSNQRGRQQGVELSGHGQAPILSLGRRRLDFAAVRQTESQDLRIELSNTGDAPLQLGAVRLGGAAAADFTLGGEDCTRKTLEPEQVCRLLVRFAPTANGPRDARLIVESNAQPQSVALTIQGVGLDPPEAGIAIDQRRLEFGAQPTGSRGEVVTLRISSSGEGRLVLGEQSIIGGDAADFRLVPGTCQGLPHIVPGGECTIGVRFTPSVAGSRSAILVIEHNANQGPVQIQITGDGL